METTTKDKFLKQVKTCSPVRYLSLIVGFKLPNEIKEELISFEMFYELKPEVINVIILYSYQLLRHNFTSVRKIAEQWKGRDVKTAEEAMKLLKEEHEKHKNWAEMHEIS